MSCRGASLSEQALTPPDAVAKRRGVYHHVKQGQTLWSIAHTYRVDVQQLRRINRLSSSAALFVGQRLYVPGVTQQREVVSRCPCQPARLAAVRSSPTISAPQRLLSITPTDEQSTPLSPSASFFAWPLQGRVSRGVEYDEGHRHNGIDIVAAQGTPVRAAADGKVVFSGWGPSGYGRMVIVQHPQGMVTIYAHNEQNYARNGEYVRQGDQVAAVGKSGRASTYHLHFEIRRKTVPVPPEQWLPPVSQQAATVGS